MQAGPPHEPLSYSRYPPCFCRGQYDRHPKDSGSAFEAIGCLHSIEDAQVDCKLKYEEAASQNLQQSQEPQHQRKPFWQHNPQLNNLPRPQIQELSLEQFEGTARQMARKSKNRESIFQEGFARFKNKQNNCQGDPSYLHHSRQIPRRILPVDSH